MLTPSMKAMIRAEQESQAGRFVAQADLEAYLEKLDARAEVVAEMAAGRCRGFVAFYCNNLETRRAFITLILVSPEDRGSGVGRALVSRALEVCRERGFTSCGLEVQSDNAAALSLYASLGFVPVSERDGRQTLECAL
jgi:ribosomal protein S18 acetylase RimI-like enzyme